MSKKSTVTLHLDWTPGWVKAVNIATGEKAEAVTLKKLGQITVGHKEALVGVGRKIVFLKAVRLPKALPEDLRRIIGVQLGQFFPLPADQLSFDFIQTSNQTHDGFLTVIAAIRADDLRLLHTELKEVGLSAQRVLPIALGSAVIAAKSGNVDALVVDTERGDFALDVVLGGLLRFSRVAPAGSELEVESKRTLAAAGASEIPTVQTRDFGDSAIKLLHEAPAFGFILSESRVLAEKQRSTARTRAAALATTLAVAIVAGVWFLRQQDVTALQQAKVHYTQLVQAQQAKESDASSTESQLSELQSDLGHAFDPGQQLSDISAYTSDCLPPGAWLTGLTVERAKQLQVRGTATSSDKVAAFVDRLGSSKRFANVKLVFANSALVGTTPVIQFNVTADPVGNLPMPTPSKDDGRVETASSSSGSDANTEGGG